MGVGVVDLPLLPLEIWNYIFDIRKHDFELLVLKFQRLLQWKISWKLCFSNKVYYTYLESSYYPYNVIIFKFSRIISAYRPVHRNGNLCEDLNEGFLMFELRIPIDWLSPSSTPKELVLSPMEHMYFFESDWPTNSNKAYFGMNRFLALGV